MTDVYQILLKRINAATTKGVLDILEKQCARHYNNFTLTVRDFTKLDVRIMEKSAVLSIAEEDSKP